MIANDKDHRIIDAVSIALDGKIGHKDDIDKLYEQIINGPSSNKLRTACEIAVAFIRWSQDLKEKK